MSSQQQQNKPTEEKKTSDVTAAEEVYPSTQIGSYLSQQWKQQEQQMKPSGYICGSCATVNVVRPKEHVRCSSCGYRILYKERQRRPMLFLAR